ncbi:MAG TPA: hypothetical protein VMY59_01720, partial [Candidatus Thermoplasmatota archaeon]|nr:hypothetical protein [Candidatus Thermoplasmatota archaeon]
GETVSKEAIIYLQTHLEEQIRNICKNARIEQNKMNSSRKSNNLRERKRFGGGIFKTVVNRYISSSTDGEAGKEGQHNSDTSLSDKQNTEVIIYD